MVASSPQPTPSAAVSAPPSSTHPAYWPLFAYYREAGQSATRALVLLAEEWNEFVDGPLPSARTARHWAKVDSWNAKMEETVAAAVPAYRAYAETRLLSSALEAVDTLLDVIHGEFPDAKTANAAARAAFGLLERGGFGPPGRSRKAPTTA